MMKKRKVVDVMEDLSSIAVSSQSQLLSCLLDRFNGKRECVEKDWKTQLKFILSKYIPDTDTHTYI